MAIGKLLKLAKKKNDGQALQHLVPKIRSAGAPSQSVRLSKAITAFRELVSGQDTWLMENRFEVNDTPPMPDDIIQITTYIEGNVKRQQSQLVTRFWDSLRMVHGATTVIDKIVGGSQNEIACSVWAIVRFTLQVSSIVPYIEMRSPWRRHCSAEECNI